MKREYVIGTKHWLTSIQEETEYLGTEVQKCHREFSGFAETYII